MHQFTPLRDVLPRPQAITMAGEVHLVAQFTLDDLADLDEWMSVAAGDPMDGLPPAACDPDPSTRRARLVAAWRAMEGVPSVGGPGAAAMLFGPEGRAVQVLLSCARAGREITAEVASRLASECSPAEWAAFDRIAWGVPAWKPIARELDPDFESWVTASDDPHDWGRSLVKACADDPSRLAAMGRLTIGQYRLLCREGEPDWYRCVPKDGETNEQLMARSSAVFRVDDSPGAEGSD